MGVKDGDKIMKKILSTLIMTAVAVSLCACSSQSAQPETAAGENEIAADSGDTYYDENVNNAAAGDAANSQSSDEMQKVTENSQESDEPQLQMASTTPKTRSFSPALSATASNVRVSESLDKAVGDAIISYNDGSYLEGECEAEGHIILDVANENSTLKVYALTTYGEYSFINDMFIKVSGSSAIPVVMSFEEEKDNTYSLLNYQEPEEGSKYVTSVKELFPQSMYNRIVPVSDTDRTALTVNERKDAKKYLDSIGRTATIGDYSDVSFEYPDVSDEIKKTVFDRYWEYPDWLGTTEKIENDVRYVYETQWKNYGNNNSMIYLTKYVYDTGEIIRTINVHIDNGVIQSSEEKVLKLIENTSGNKR